MVAHSQWSSISYVPSESAAVSNCSRAYYLSGIVICLAATIALAACQGKSPLTQQQAEGKHLYDVRCAHCHQDNDLNLKKVPPDLHGVFTRTTLPGGAPASDAEVARVIMTGKGMMPSFAGRFTDEQMAALLAYLHAGLR
jgi:mono/diheme cytochrome c family protein